MSDKQPLEERVQQAILRESVLRWESAVIIALTLLAAAVTGLNGIGSIPPSLWWTWLLGGLVAEALLVYRSLTSSEFGQKVAANLLRREFRPEKLRDIQVQRQVKEALDYRSRIEEVIRSQDDSVLRDDLIETAGQIDNWIEHIYNLARRIDRYQKEKRVLRRDRQRGELRIIELQRELEEEDDEVVRQQIQVTIDGLARQLESLERLDNTIQRAQLQLENTLTSLGTIYSQTMLVDAKDIDSSRARRLRHEVSEEVNELNDVLLAMDEVYSAESIA